jgi:hypothetical protein
MVGFFVKPGFFVIFIFWFFYLTGLTYYGGKDKKRRYNMAKFQNREDLAEVKDPEIQQVDVVMKEILLRGNLLDKKAQDDKRDEQKQITEAMKHDGYSDVYIERAMIDIKARQKKDVLKDLPKTVDDLSAEEKKELRKRAFKKVFGRVGDMSDRARRLFKKNGKTPDDMMDFFWIEFKNNYWFGLMSKTSKIAPRHTRLTVMYFGIAI